jgi:2-polyprenyl-3-methyl-5-hydroxy-6-metoxy-1,4-benzoquinol methylase
MNESGSSPRSTATALSAPFSAPLYFAVLQSAEEIELARQRLADEGLLGAAYRRKPIISAIRDAVWKPAPDLKTWDVVHALAALRAHVEPSEPVLDVGSIGCAILPSLHRLGYTNLSGIDLNPDVLKMPYADLVDYRVGDLTDTAWENGRFAAITAISVIEHGVDADSLCREVSRLLRPGGLFLFTTDYWPAKISTSKQLFGLEWRIFSAGEITELVEIAASHGLTAVGDPISAIGAVGERAVHWEDEDYTFLYGAFVRGTS